MRVPHFWSKGQSWGGAEIPSAALWRSGHGSAVPGAVAAPTPNPLGTYGTHAESGFIAIMVILISTTYNNRSQPKYWEK